MTDIVFDLDDTLIKTTQHYINTERYFADLFNGFGIPRDEILELIKLADLKLLEEFKYGYQWYQQGLEDVYEQLRAKYAIKIEGINDLLKNKIAVEFKLAIPELWDNSKDILEYFKQLNCRLFIMTLGDYDVQMAKIVKADLEKYFDHIFTVGRKDDADFQNLIKKTGVIPENTYFVGNSIVNDIIPASKAGFKCILYDKFTSFYGQEFDIPDNVKVITDLNELKTIIKP